ncbi:hypothetical protein DV735_g1415, partial [Chaetothyriales sp. CBS 134920]
MPIPPSEYVSNVWRPDIFKGKVVFATGGNGSICSAQVRALVHLGADAAIVGRNTEKTEAVAIDLATARAGSRVVGIGGVDVRDVASLQRAVDRTVQELGGIDFLIAGAAGNFLAPIAGLSSNAFARVIEIDLLGSYNTTKVVLPHLLESVKKHNSPGALPKDPSNPLAHGPGGRIIYVSATLHYSGTPLQTHAAAAKAGVDALSANVSLEYGPFGITSNVIAPGPIGGTEGMDRLSGLANSDRANQAPAKAVPLGRWGKVKEIADATVYLFSDTGNYVSGQITVVDGSAWRVTGIIGGPDFSYPDFLLSGATEVTGVRGAKGEAKL